jgi:acetolactate synthase-1/2/3 large subunit
MKGSATDIIVKCLEVENVDYIFGVPGGHLLPLYDSLYRAGSVKPVLSRHEQGAAYMACGYALASGKIGVCCGTVGPGATNLVSGVASAYMDSIPMLVLTAQVGTRSIGHGALQEGAGHGRTIHHVGIFEKMTKMSTLELSSEAVPFALRRALRVAQTGRPGPVHIDLPADVQAGKVDDSIMQPDSYRVTGGPSPSADDVARAAELLLKAKRPAILVGAGLKDGALLPRLALSLSCPVATTLRAKGLFDESHPLALGVVGLYGTRLANSYVRSDTDVLLVVGASMHEFTTHCWDPAVAPDSALIQVDIDPGEIGKNYPVKVGVACDAARFVSMLAERIGGEVRDGHDVAREQKKTEYFDEKPMHDTGSPLKPQRVMSVLSRALPQGSIVFADIGNTLAWAERNLQLTGSRLHTLSGLAAMGSATAAAVGGKLGSPGSTVVCVCGDGDFMMNGIEVGTAVAHSIPVVWVVLDNGCLGMIRDVQKMSYQHRKIACELGDTDIVGLAHSLGANARRVSSDGELGPALEEALRSDTPSVVVVPIDRDEMPPPKPRMMALQRSLGLPGVAESMSWTGIKALWKMLKER